MLIRAQSGVEEDGIYLPKGFKIVHFGELEDINENKPEIELETSCKGLSQELQNLKNRLLEYSQAVISAETKPEK